MSEDYDTVLEKSESVAEQELTSRRESALGKLSSLQGALKTDAIHIAKTKEETR